jgi:hypothetical protein
MTTSRVGDLTYRVRSVSAEPDLVPVLLRLERSDWEEIKSAAGTRGRGAALVRLILSDWLDKRSDGILTED